MDVSHLQHISPSPLDVTPRVSWGTWAVQDTPILLGHPKEWKLERWRGRGKMGPHQLWWRSSFHWVLLCASGLSPLLWVSQGEISPQLPLLFATLLHLPVGKVLPFMSS